jgi:hypothetical protein
MVQHTDDLALVRRKVAWAPRNTEEMVRQKGLLTPHKPMN